MIVDLFVKYEVLHINLNIIHTNFFLSSTYLSSIYLHSASPSTSKYPQEHLQGSMPPRMSVCHSLFSHFVFVRRLSSSHPFRITRAELTFIPKCCNLFIYLVFLFIQVFFGIFKFWARGPIGAAAASLCQSHSNTISELCLGPTPQLMARPDPPPNEWGQGSTLQPHGS